MRGLVLAVLMFALLAGCSGSKSSHPTYPAEAAPSCGTRQLFTTPDGQAFCVSNGWTADSENDFGRDWFAYSPLDDATDFRENINMGRTSPDGTVEAMGAKSKRQLATVFEDFVDLGQTSSKVGSHPASTIHYRGTLGGNTVEGLQTYVYGNGKVHILTYTFTPGRDLYASDVAAMYDSFRFTKGG